ncbi:MAG: SIR2 family protein [Nitrosomonas sp.]|nr:SIR2 family protein [Nitrosomonas sp.]UJP00083.1 MAG: SIR2 family protein [Nitrosomonas sp.]
MTETVWDYWKETPSQADNLRLFMPKSGWRRFSDRLKEDDGAVEEQGSKTHIESAFINALNATNLLILTGAGTSFCVKNKNGEAQAPSMSDLWAAVKTKVTESVFDQVCTQFPNAPINNNIEKLLSLCKIYLELNENADTKSDETAKRIKNFVNDAEQAILEKVDFVSGETNVGSHADFIRKIGRRGVRKQRVKLFTTNYDLCFEEAARRQRFTIIDGFSHSLDQVYDRSHFDFDLVRREIGKDAPDYISNVFHLYKLHGSRDWRKIDNEIVRSRDKTLGSPVLIFPRSSKYQEAFEPPYLDMLGAFQAALREPDTALIISGFGFNDDHISRPIMAAMESNMSLRLIICDPIFILSTDSIKGVGTEPAAHDIQAIPDAKNSFLLRLYNLADSGDPRIHLVNGRFDDMALAMPDLVGETDRERHIERVKVLREEGKRA